MKLGLPFHIFHTLGCVRQVHTHTHTCRILSHSRRCHSIALVCCVIVPFTSIFIVPLVLQHAAYLTFYRLTIPSICIICTEYIYINTFSFILASNIIIVATALVRFFHFFFLFVSIFTLFLGCIDFVHISRFTERIFDICRLICKIRFLLGMVNLLDKSDEVALNEHRTGALAVAYKFVIA